MNKETKELEFVPIEDEDFLIAVTRQDDTVDTFTMSDEEFLALQKALGL